jgi:hypothetical protein
MFVIKKLSEQEMMNAFDNRFCGYSFRVKSWPPDLAVHKTKDQKCFISNNYKDEPNIASWICSELLEPLHYSDIEVVEDFEGFERNFLIALIDPDLFDTEEEKLQVATSFIEQIREI